MRVASSIFPSIFNRLTQVDNHEYLEFTKVSNHNVNVQYIKLDSFQSINTYCGPAGFLQISILALVYHLHTDNRVHKTQQLLANKR